MITNITLLKAPFDKNNNFIVEDLWQYFIQTQDSYLNVGTIPFDPKIKKNMTLKIDIPSSINLNMGYSSKFQYNYVRLVTQYAPPTSTESNSSQWFYFFIVDYKWISDHAIELSLEMDILNTFVCRPDSFHSNIDYDINPKSLIHRQHMNRWNKVGNAYYRNIYAPSEDNSIVKYNKTNDVIREGSQCWYLIYKNRNNLTPTDYQNINPVDMFLIPKYTTTLRIYHLAKELNTFYQGTYLRIFSYNGIYPTFYLDNNQHLTDKCTLITSDNLIRWVEVTRDHVIIYESHKEENNYWVTEKLKEVSVGGIYLANIPQDTYGAYQTSSLFDSTSHVSPLENNNTIILGGSLDGDARIDSIDFIDRTDSKLIKIIELPYPPVIVENNYAYGTGWNVEIVSLHNNSNVMALKINTDVPELEVEVNYYSEVFKGLIKGISSSEVTTLKNTYSYNSYLNYPEYESKMYHSDYTSYKWLYDSFSCDVIGEYVNISELATMDNNESFTFKMKPSANFNSNIMFTFDMPLTHSTTDYDNLLISNRNNEYPIFTSAYLNYVRNGYNYDMKNKDMSARTALVNMASGIARGAVTATLVTDNPLASVVGGVVGLATSMTQSVLNQEKMQQAIDAKMAQSKSQAISVATSDDLSFMRSYTKGNKLHVLSYEPSEAMKEILLSKFHYFGYQINKQGYPDLISRYWFNYCEAEIILEDIKHIPQEIQDDIKNKWKQGITFIHRREQGGLSIWNFAQNWLNMETHVLGGID